MTIQPGTKFGPYEILEALGAGGMGEVYRARDSRLNRIVALKVLADHLSTDETLRQRFEREAKTISSLNHPHICTLHDIGHHNGTDFLVMEFIEGETLLSRLRKGPLSTQDLLQYSTQIADALDKAHRQGIVHRDLKPGNIMLTKSGAKLLDFGLARKDTLIASTQATSNLATASEPLTGKGTILGTLAYMAPEQLEGKEADTRTDIFAFGTVIYEMATGRRAFQGNSQASLITAIMSSDPPPISSVQQLSPPALDQLVKTCLAKDPDDRIQNAHDLMIELRWIAASMSQSAMSAPQIKSDKKKWIAAILAALILGLASGYFLSRNATSTAIEPQTVRSILRVPQRAHLDGWGSPVVAFSPDGKKIAYVAERDGVQQLYVHQLNQDMAQVVPSSEEAEGPFFSPDSEWVAFAVGVSSQSGIKGELKKYSLSTGLTQTICDTTDFFGGSWGDDGTIIFTGLEYKGLWRVSESGGTAQHFGEKWKVNGKEVGRALLWPQVLKGSKKAIVIDGYAPHGFGVAVADLATRDLKDLGIPATFARYTSSGHLVYSRRDATLMAVPFDLDRMETTGPSVALLKELCLSGNDAAVFDVSQNGSLIYLTGYLRYSRRELSKIVSINQKGEIRALSIQPDLFGGYLSSSSDGRRIAVSTYDGSLWVYDVQRGTRIKIVDGNRMTTDNPLWTPDGTKIIYSAFPEGGGSNLFWQRSDGSGTEEMLVGDVTEKHAVSWTPEGTNLIYEYFASEKSSGVYIFKPGTKEPPKILINAKWPVRQARISPDGKWIVYTSAETGKFQIYVERFPEFQEKVQISIEGGRTPFWTQDGKKIFYRNEDRFMMVPVATDSRFDAGTPQLLFEAKDIGGFDFVNYTGEIYAVQRDPNSGIQTSFHLVTNWLNELQRLAPAKKN